MSRITPSINDNTINNLYWHNDMAPAINDQHLNDGFTVPLKTLVNVYNGIVGYGSANILSESDEVYEFYLRYKDAPIITKINGVDINNMMNNGNLTLTKSAVSLGNVDNVSNRRSAVNAALKLLSAYGPTGSNPNVDAGAEIGDEDTIGYPLNGNVLLTLGNAYTPVYFEDGDAKSTNVVNNTSATSITAEDKLITANTLYYALPKINNKNANQYNSATTAYAPTTAGTQGQILRSAGGTLAPTWDSPADNTAATALSNSSTKLITERAVYNGTPTINGSKTYTSATTLFAPVAAGTTDDVLIGGGANPTWKAINTLSVASATKATQDASGNVITTTYATKAQAVTDIEFESDPSSPNAGCIRLKYANNTYGNWITVYAQPIQPVLIQPTAPGTTAPFTNYIWIDSANGYIMKVWNGTNWIAPRSVWGG